MLGAIMISSDVTSWSQDYRDIVADAISYYKVNRGFWHGRAYNVLPQSSFCLPDTVFACACSWDAVEYLEPQSGHARMFVFRTEHPDTSQIICLQGLDADSSYVLTDSAGDTLGGGPLSGSSLMTSGIEIVLPCRNSSEIVEIEKQ
jgi:hypothetical protein